MERQLGLQEMPGAHLGHRTQHAQQSAGLILERDLPPPSPVTAATSEGAEDWDIYDMTAHLSPVSTATNEGSTAGNPPGARIT
eukprot:4676112-Pyramimonas_sp.AAC.1